MGELRVEVSCVVGEEECSQLEGSIEGMISVVESRHAKIKSL